MSIALDGLPLTTPKTGVGHYTFELALALAARAPANEFELVYPSSYPTIELHANPAASVLPQNLKLERVPVGPLARHWWSNGLPRYVRRNSIELFHGTNYDVPLWRRCPSVLTIHDLSLLLHPETHQKRSVRRARRRLPLMARTADAIIVPTECVRAEVCEHLKILREKVFAIPEAARASFRPTDAAQAAAVRQRLGVRENFLLAVGTIEPRKNLLLLLSAFEALKRIQPDSDLQLVIAGGHGWLSGPLFEALEKSPARNRILLTDYLHDDDLRGLYSSCRAFVYPSIYEGFGLPPLEAMACGAPVIASRIPTLIETLGSAARFFDPRSSEQLVESIIQVTTDHDLRQGLIIAGLRQAEKFSWERTAQATLEVYEVARKNFANRVR
jgi:glycosyltransferase involved in cell wall biosynthesis